MLFGVAVYVYGVDVVADCVVVVGVGVVGVVVIICGGLFVDGVAVVPVCEVIVRVIGNVVIRGGITVGVVAVDWLVVLVLWCVLLLLLL